MREHPRPKAGHRHCCRGPKPMRGAGEGTKVGGPTAPLPSRAESILCSSQLSRTNRTEVEEFGGPV